MDVYGVGVHDAVVLLTVLPDDHAHSGDSLWSFAIEVVLSEGAHHIACAAMTTADGPNSVYAEQINCMQTHPACKG